MRLVAFPVAGAGGREVFVNPDQVICILDIGDRRTQIVTTGLSSEASISLIVGLGIAQVAARLGSMVEHEAAAA